MEYTRLPPLASTSSRPSLSQDDIIPAIIAQYLPSSINAQEQIKSKLSGGQLSVLLEDVPLPAKTQANPVAVSIGKVSKAARRKRRPVRHTWASVLPLHALWVSYVSELAFAHPHSADISPLPLTIKPTLSTSASTSASASASSPASTSAPSASAQASTSKRPTASGDILRADLTGSFIQIVRSVNPGLVGIAGIVLIETKSMWIIVTKSRGTKTVSKKGTDARCFYPCTYVRQQNQISQKQKLDVGKEAVPNDLLQLSQTSKSPITSNWAYVTIFGDAVLARPPDRSTGKKIKARNILA